MVFSSSAINFALQYTDCKVRVLHANWPDFCEIIMKFADLVYITMQVNGSRNNSYWNNKNS